MTAQRGDASPNPDTGTDLGLTAVPKAARAFQTRPAGVVSRLLAAAVNLGVLVVLGGATYLGAAGLVFLWSPRHAHFPHVPRAWIVIAAGVLLVLYLTAAWTTSGRTYGDQLLGLRVLGPRQHRMHLARALLRALICTVFPAGLLWAAISPARRSVADVVLRTSVVYDWVAQVPVDD
jgi:uncharacterized RDD family membrane protein YckC